MVTLTFDHDIQTRSSEGSNTSSLWIWRISIQQFPRYFIHKQKCHRQHQNQNLMHSTACGKIGYVNEPWIKCKSWIWYADSSVIFSDVHTIHCIFAFLTYDQLKIHSSKRLIVDLLQNCSDCSYSHNKSWDGWPSLGGQQTTSVFHQATQANSAA